MVVGGAAAAWSGHRHRGDDLLGSDHGVALVDEGGALLARREQLVEAGLGRVAPEARRDEVLGDRVDLGDRPEGPGHGRHGVPAARRLVEGRAAHVHHAVGVRRERLVALRRVPVVGDAVGEAVGHVPAVDVQGVDDDLARHLPPLLAEPVVERGDDLPDLLGVGHPDGPAPLERALEARLDEGLGVGVDRPVVLRLAREHGELHLETVLARGEWLAVLG